MDRACRKATNQHPFNKPLSIRFPALSRYTTIAAALYASLAKPIKDITEGVGRVNSGRVDVSLPHQGGSGVLGALANAVTELVERQSRELAEAQTAGQQAARQVETLELRLADRERELESLREHCATLQAVDEVTDLPNRAAFDAELDQELKL